MHTILGANGVIGRELSLALAADGEAVRQVSRHPRKVNPGDETLAADLLDPGAAARAVAGSEVAYLVAGLKYDTAVWRDQWPRLMRNVIDACKRHGAEPAPCHGLRAAPGRDFARLACELAGRPATLQVAPRWMLRAMGLLVPVLRENQEMMYQFEHPYRFDSGRIRAAYGLEATAYREGIARSLGIPGGAAP